MTVFENVSWTVDRFNKDAMRAAETRPYLLVLGLMNIVFLVSALFSSSPIVSVGSVMLTLLITVFIVSRAHTGAVWEYTSPISDRYGNIIDGIGSIGSYRVPLPWYLQSCGGYGLSIGIIEPVQNWLDENGIKYTIYDDFGMGMHLYFNNSAEAILFKNRFFVDENQYAIVPGSSDPATGLPYRVIDKDQYDSAISSMGDSSMSGEH